MQLPERFYIEGKSYRLGDILDLCQNMAGDPNQPEWKRGVMTFIHWFLDPGSEELLQETSGTTGDPKATRLDREKMISSAGRTIRFFNMKQGERVLLCLPIRYIAGKMMAVRALVGGLDLVLTEPSGRPLQALSAEVSYGAMVPLQVYESLRHGDDLSLIRQLLVGGGELHTVIRNPLEQRDEPIVYETFAMTETYTHFALKRINGEKPDEEFRLMEGVSIQKDDRGCMMVEVPGVTSGQVITNDLVEISGNGTSFRWHGRYDNLINSGGIKIVPESLEQKIEEILGYPCLVLPEADARLGQRLVLMVETEELTTDTEPWKKVLHHKLEGHENPKEIVRVRSIPRNASFKPDRREATILLNSR